MVITVQAAGMAKTLKIAAMITRVILKEPELMKVPSHKSTDTKPSEIVPHFIGLPKYHAFQQPSHDHYE